MGGTDWVAWHRVYDDPDSRFSHRLHLTQAHLREVLDRHPSGPIRIVVPCAGQGHDVLGVLADHPRRDDVTATLIELDPGNVDIARATARQLDLPGVTVVNADAGLTDAYVDAVPASVLLFAGMLGHLTKRDIRRLLRRLPQLCARDACIVWAYSRTARHHSVEWMRQRFETAGFRELPTSLASNPDVYVGVQQFVGEPASFQPNERLFTFRSVYRGPGHALHRLRRSVTTRSRRLSSRVLWTRRTNWVAWHDVYDDPESRFSGRLRLVQAHVREVLDRHPPGPIRVIVPCAGQGRDLLGVLRDHPRRADVTATLVDIDPGNAEVARSAARELGLSGVTVVERDAGRSDAYVGAVPATVVLLVGFFVYLTEPDLARFIHCLPQLCARDAVVVWARGTVAATHSPASIRQHFEDAGFVAVPSDVEPASDIHVGIERFTGTPIPLRPGQRWFSFRDPLRLTHNTLRRARKRLARSVRRQRG